MWASMSSTTSASLWPRATYPHSQLMSLAISRSSPVTLEVYAAALGGGLATVWRVPPPLASPLDTRIQVCGPLVARVRGRRVERDLPGRQGRLLFVHLVVGRERPASREALTEALWPGGAPAAAPTALAALLSKLRRALGPEALEAREGVRLVLPEGAWVDLEAAADAAHRAESALAQEDWPRAWGASQVALFAARRGFLPEEDAPWIDEWRRHLDALHVRALETYATASLGIGGAELATAERAGRELVGRAPFRESGYSVLMRALARAGNTAEALRVYEELRCLLRDELGVAPAPALQELHAQLLRGAA